MTLLERLKHKPRLEDVRRISKSIAEFNVSQLNPREYALYQLLMEGYTLKESVNKLSLHHSLGKKQRKEIYKILGVKSQAELIINYREVSERKDFSNNDNRKTGGN